MSIWPHKLPPWSQGECFGAISMNLKKKLLGKKWLLSVLDVYVSKNMQQRLVFRNFYSFTHTIMAMHISSLYTQVSPTVHGWKQMTVQPWKKIWKMNKEDLTYFKHDNGVLLLWPTRLAQIARKKKKKTLLMWNVINHFFNLLIWME